MGGEHVRDSHPGACALLGFGGIGVGLGVPHRNGKVAWTGGSYWPHYLNFKGSLKLVA